MKPGTRVSYEYEPYINSGLDHVGSVFRYVKFKNESKDDFYFSRFCQKIYGRSPREIWPDYDRVLPNKEALFPSLMKYDKQPFQVNEKAWNFATEWAIKHFHAAVGSHELIGDESIFDLMELKSSPGYPFVLLPEGKSKRSLLDQEGIRDYCFQYNKDISYTQMPTLWNVHEKEEIRTRTKVIINRIRTFVGSSLAFLFTCMCMFYEMNLRLYESAAKFMNWSFVGATKFYGGWNHVYRRLMKHPNAFELDETDYDCSLSQRMLETAAYIRRNFLENCSSRQWNKILNIYTEIIFSYIVTPFGDVLMKKGGNPSGSFNTITDNTILLYVLLSYAWLMLCEDKFKTYESFHKHVEAILCGDDNTWTVSNEALVWYNARSVSWVWSNIGVTTKTDHWEARKLHECWFMSSAFHRIKHPVTGVEFVVPMPETQKVIASLAFSLKYKNAKWSLLRALALRIESFYNIECRSLIWQFIRWIEDNYAAELHSECDIKDPHDFLSYNDVMSVLKTDNQIQMLYCVRTEGSLFTANALEALRFIGCSLNLKPYKIFDE
jgi:hypothetical protein